jgi:hypothetical protein
MLSLEPFRDEQERRAPDDARQDQQQQIDHAVRSPVSSPGGK